MAPGIIIAIIISILMIVIAVGAAGTYLYLSKDTTTPPPTGPTPEEIAAQKQLEELQKQIDAQKAAAAAAQTAAARAAAEAEAKRLADQQAQLKLMLQNACKMSCGQYGSPMLDAANNCTCTPCLSGYTGAYCEKAPYVAPPPPPPPTGPTAAELAEIARLEAQRIAALRSVNTAKCIDTCGDNGTPTLLADNITCTCKPCLNGYTGTYCDVPRVCPNKCLNGGTQDPVTCACTCLSTWKGSDCSVRNCDNVVCGNGVPNPNNDCNCVCNAGYHLDMGMCVADAVVVPDPCAGLSCPNGTMSPTTCGCLSCNTGYDLINGKCVAVCGQYYQRDQSGNCVRTSCPPNQTFSNGVCITDPCAGKSCLNGTMDPVTCKCSSCGAGYDLVSGTCSPGCSQYFTRDQFGTCVRTSCPPGQTLTNGVCTTVITDPCAGKSCLNGTMDPVSCACSSCASGYELYNNSCVAVCPQYYSRSATGTCVRTSCPPGFTLSGIDGTCTANTPTCTAGYELYNNSCVAVCPQYYSRNAAGTCIRTSCPQGFTLNSVDGTCTANTTSCPAGYTLINGICEQNAAPPVTCDVAHGILDETTGQCSSCDFDYTGNNCTTQLPWTDYPKSIVTRLIKAAVNTPLFIKTPTGKQTQILDDCNGSPDSCKWQFTPISKTDTTNNPQGLANVYYIQPITDLTKYLRVGGGSVWFGAKPTDVSGAFEMRQGAHGGSYFFRPLSTAGQYLATVGIPGKDGLLQTSSTCFTSGATKGCEWQLTA